MLQEEIQKLVKGKNYSIIVLDSTLAPAIDVVRDLKLVHAMLSPNCLKDTFVAQQPRGSMFWKYPA